MIDVIIYHHAQGLTAGVQEFAERLMAAGHRVMVPDLYDGETFDTVDEGVEHAETIGFDTIIDRGVSVATATDNRFACVGFSLGVLPAQNLAQTHRRAAGAVLCHAAIPLGTFADEWPSGVALQIHTSERDPLGDFEDARELAKPRARERTLRLRHCGAPGRRLEPRRPRPRDRRTDHRANTRVPRPLLRSADVASQFGIDRGAVLGDAAQLQRFVAADHVG